MTAKDDAEILGVTVEQFADAVEEQHNTLLEMASGDSPEAALFRSFFSEGFLEEKARETEEYLKELRKESE